MRIAGIAVVVVLVCGHAVAQSPLPRATTPRFDIISVRKNTTGELSQGDTPLPGGGARITNFIAAQLISRAYPGHAPVDMVGLPAWATADRYDVTATASLTQPTSDDRSAMMRALLADRFNFVAHMEMREQAVYDLVLARPDAPKGPGVEPSDVDCTARLAAQRAAAEAARAAGAPPAPLPPIERNGNMPVCSFFLAGDQMVGEHTIDALARLLRAPAGRPIVDKTGLTKTYKLRLLFDRMGSSRGPDTAAAPGAAPSVFSALPEQIGLKLESSRTMRETLVIDRLERPTEN